MCELPHRTLKNENGIGKVRDNRVGVQPTTHGELFICAKDLFVEATASPQTWNRRQDAGCVRERRGCWLKPKMRAPRRSHCPSSRSGEHANPHSRVQRKHHKLIVVASQLISTKVA